MARELCTGQVYADYGGYGRHEESPRHGACHPGWRAVGHRAPDYSPVGPALLAENQAQGETVSTTVTREGVAQFTSHTGDQHLACAGPEKNLRRCVPAVSD